MVGLRTQESSKFKSFFSIVQNAARDKEAIFFWIQERAVILFCRIWKAKIFPDG